MPLYPRRFVKGLSEGRRILCAEEQPTMTNALSEGPFEEYPETFSIRHRYQCDGSIVISTPEGPIHFSDWMDFWAAIGRNSSLVAETKKVVGRQPSRSARRLYTFTTILAVLSFLVVANEFTSDASEEWRPDKTAAVSKADRIEEKQRVKASTESVSIDVTNALGKAVTQKIGSGPNKTKAISQPNKAKLETAETPAQAEKPSDDVAASEFAAEEGHANAEFAMGRKYEDGQGVPRNYFEAMKWYRLAAEQGHAIAQYRLGLMYKEGRGIPPDFVEAYMWLSLAASGLPASDTDYRDSVIQNQNLAAVRLTPKQLGETQRLAREWKPKPVAR